MEHISLIQRKVRRDLFHDLTNLTGGFQSNFKFNTAEKIVVTDLIDLGWFFSCGEDDGQGNGQKAVLADIGSIQDILTGAGGFGDSIRVDGVDWISEGMRVGDSFWMSYKLGTTNYISYGTVQAIKGDTIITIRTNHHFGVNEALNLKICNNTTYFNLDLYGEFQTLDNEDAINLATNERNFISFAILTNSYQKGVFNGANKAGNVLVGSKARLASSSINYPALGFPATVRRYEISYYLYCPFWLENNRLDKIFAGDSNLRFNTRLDFRRSNQLGKDTLRQFDFNALTTEIGYYLEDGLSGNKFILSADFAPYDTDNKIDILNESSVVFRIYTNILSTDNALNIGDKFSVLLFAKKDSSDYQFNETGYFQAFGAEYKTSTLSAVTINANDVITKILSGVGVEDGKKFIEVRLNVNYNKYNYKERFVEGDEWRVVFNFKGLNNEVNACFIDGVFIQNTDEEGLLTTNHFKIHDQFSNILTQNQNSLKANIQDTIYVDYKFQTNPLFGYSLTNEIKSINVRLIAYRSLNGEEKWFELTSQNINLGLVQYGNINQILLNNTYLSDYAVDKTNLDTISIITEGAGFGKTGYILKCPLKITWQDWNEIEADPLFYNEDLDFNGFNQNAMTYFNKLGFTIHACVDVELYRGVSGITTIYRQKSEPLQLIDKNDGYLIGPIEIKTYDLNNNDLNGNLLQGEPTRIEAKFAHDNLPNVATIFAYELVEQNGFALIENSTGGTLQGLWVTKPSIKSITATEVIVQAQINSDGNAYNISCKIQEAPADVNEYNYEYNEDFN